ncbi:hypothetical protein B0T18DRAFT_178705 [Schizothecium vesticola]|uniref:Uncharacterized protein n=1 Tax=Schizothecium vesticola TaxID=314040 RepID=A0AA40K254_9PEZI|nr:hypothetical protein B0T18DRAFT_178705 [Schizothecium vesticola]
MQPPANKVFLSSLSIEDMEATARHAGLVHRYPSRLSTAPPSSTLLRQPAQQDHTIQDIISWDTARGIEIYPTTQAAMSSVDLYRTFSCVFAAF